MSRTPDPTACERPDCSIDWLLSLPQAGPERDAWMARVRAEWQAAPPVVGRPTTTAAPQPTMAPRPLRGRLKDGRLSGVLCRRLLDGAVRYPGQLIGPETLAAHVWGDAPPPTWRIGLPALVKQLNARLGATVLVRIGSPKRLHGFRLDPTALPRESVTRRRTKAATRWPWSHKEDEVLKLHAGRRPLSELTTLVNAVHGRQRKATSVEGRLYLLGLSKRIRAYSANSLAPILGVDGVKITRWIEGGKLRGRRSEPDGWTEGSKRWGWWLIEHADVELFIRAYPWEVDWRAMQPGHPLTTVAMTVQRRDPYVTIAEAARRIGCTETALWQRLRVGKVPHVRVTPVSPSASAERASIRIQLSALEGMPVRLPKGPRPHPFTMEAI